MKIAIGYPPLASEKGIPFLGQNRQFQWGKAKWNAYPIVPAYAATILKKAGHRVVWLDGIAEGWSDQKWLSEIKKEKPDLIMMETKAPVVKRHWQVIEKLKAQSSKLKVILVGDHVTALPEESLRNSPVDYILTGGDYDFLLLNLVNHLNKGEKLESGIWFRSQNLIKNTGKFVLNHQLDDLPFIDRELTCWPLYAYKNSNYSRTPGTYTMFGRDCWWGKCIFCSWVTLYPGAQYRVMSPKRALDEIGYILDHYPVKEIMDDSGTFPTGDWLVEFCRGMISRGYHRKIKLDCNMRFNADLAAKDYRLMAKAGFRFVLFGLESANQKTLDRINKNLQVEQMETTLKMAKKAGLWPHVTVMVGYPWESKKEVLETLNLTKRLFRKGLIDTLQATVVIPYPGTPLFAECQKNGWLKTLDWDRYDMKGPVMKTPMSDEEVVGLVKGIFSSFWSPEFLFRKLKEALTDGEKLRYYLFFAGRYFGKLLEFK